MLWFVPLLLASALEGPAGAGPSHIPPLVTAREGGQAAATLTSPMRRIRSPEPRVVAMLAYGATRSRTFADLVWQVHRSDVIVYVESSFALPHGTKGRMLLQNAGGRTRYVRVQVQASLHRDDMIAVIAHELRHALEVAADSSVVDDATLMALYRRIGHVTTGTKNFDTDAAVMIGRQVRNELAA